MRHISEILCCNDIADFCYPKDYDNVRDRYPFVKTLKANKDLFYNTTNLHSKVIKMESCKEKDSFLTNSIFVRWL